MKIEYDSKFNIGDEVFIVKRSHEHNGQYIREVAEVKKKKYKIKSMRLDVKENKISLEYYFDNCLWGYECDVFLTHEEAHKRACSINGIQYISNKTEGDNGY